MNPRCDLIIATELIQFIQLKISQVKIDFLLGTACFPPYSPCPIDAMLPVLPYFTDTTMAGAPGDAPHAKRFAKNTRFSANVHPHFLEVDT